MLIFMTHNSGKNRTSHTSRNEHCMTTKQALVAPSLYCMPFLKEFRVVGQICREGMDDSGILPKARYAMTVFHCLEQLGVWRLL